MIDKIIQEYSNYIHNANNKIINKEKKINSK